MKPILTIATTLLMGTQFLSAQEVAIDSLQQASSTHVYNSIVSRTDDQEGHHTWNLNLLGVGSEDINITVKQKPCPGRSTTSMGVEHPYFGWSELSAKGFDLRATNSLEFGFNIIETKRWNQSRTFGMEIDLGISWTRYAVKGGNVFYNDPDGQTLCAPFVHPEGRDYSRSRLTYASWRLPMKLNFRDKAKHEQFSIGVEAELRHHLRSRIKVGHDKKYYAESHDLSVNPFSCNLLVSYSFKDFSFIGRYGLTDFFDQGNTKLSAHPFMIGFGFGI